MATSVQVLSISSKNVSLLRDSIFQNNDRFMVDKTLLLFWACAKLKRVCNTVSNHLGSNFWWLNKLIGHMAGALTSRSLPNDRKMTAFNKRSRIYGLFHWFMKLFQKFSCVINNLHLFFQVFYGLSAGIVACGLISVLAFVYHWRRSIVPLYYPPNSSEEINAEETQHNTTVDEIVECTGPNCGNPQL